MKKLGLLVLVPVLLIGMAGMALAGGGAEEDPDDEVGKYLDVECNPEAELDDGYCDYTGDLVADPPTNPDYLLDPNVLVFAYAPTEDPAVYEGVFEPFIEFLEDRLARPVQWYGIRSYAAQIEAMRAGRLHISGMSAGMVEQSVNTAGFVPQTNMGGDGTFIGYHMAIITQPDSDIESVEDLRGREVAFVSETSNSGYFAPRAILYEEFGMLPGEDYSTAFSGSHDNSILGVLHGDYEAAAIADGVLLRMVEGGRVPGSVDDIYEDFKLLYESPEFPPSAWGVAYNLEPELQERIKQAFLEYDWEGTPLDEEWGPEDGFYETNYKEYYEVLRTIRRGSAEVEEILGE